jgi:hypothetical protein
MQPAPEGSSNISAGPGTNSHCALLGRSLDETLQSAGWSANDRSIHVAGPSDQDRRYSFPLRGMAY